MTTFAIGVENAAGDSGATVDGGYIAAVEEATGAPATNALLEAPAAYWRSTTTNAGIRVKFGQDRQVGSIAAGPHVASRHAAWQMATGRADEPARRPYARFDGIDDYGLFGGIAASADMTIMTMFRVHPQLVANNTAQCRLWVIADATDDVRFQAHIAAGSGGTPYQLLVLIDNYGPFDAITTTWVPDGLWHRMIFRYRNSDKLAQAYMDGVLIGSATAVTSWVSAGVEKGALASSTVPGFYSKVEYMDFRILGRYIADSEITAYRGQFTTSRTRGILKGYHFGEGSGVTVVDQAGTGDMTLTGATWPRELAHPASLFTADRSVWGPWQSRRGIDFGAATGPILTSTTLGTEPRCLTLACTIKIPVDAFLVSTANTFVSIQPAAGSAALTLQTLSDGKVRALAAGRGTVLVESTSALNDGGVYRLRATLNGHTDALELWVGAPGAAEVSQGTVATTAYAGVASELLRIGNSPISGLVLSDVRVWPRIVLEAEDPMTEDGAARWHNPLALVNLDGSVIDGANPSRVYTNTGGAAVYGWIHQAAGDVDSLGGTDARLISAGVDPFANFQHLLCKLAAADVTASEIWIEMSDPTGPGYVQLGTVHAAAAERPPNGVDVEGQVRRHTAPAVVRSARSGAVALGEGYTAWGYTGRLRIASGRTTATLATDAQEFEARLVRRPDPSKLVTVWAVPKSTTPDHRLIEHVVVGIYKPEGAGVADIVFDSFPITVDGVL